MKSVLTLVAIGMAGPLCAGPISVFSLDPQSSFLVADTNTTPNPLPDAPGAPLVIDVSAFAGQSINIAGLGGYCAAGTATAGTVAMPCNSIGGPGIMAELAANLGGIFSQDSTLLDITSLQRVPNAVASGLPSYNSSGTNWFYHNTVSTYNPFDFLIPNGAGVNVGVPQTAHYLFVGVYDSFYRDNTDPEHGLGVQITASTLRIAIPAVPEPGTYSMLLCGFFGLLILERLRPRRS